MKKRSVKIRNISRFTAAVLFAVALTGMSQAGSVEGWAATAAETAAAAATAAAVPSPTEYGHITSCAIVGGNQISIQGQVEGTWSDPAFYDNYLYLFELKPYQDDLNGRSDYCGWITKGDALSFTIPLNSGGVDDRLYSKFVIAVYDGSKYIPAGNVVYVTNPESIAKHTDAYQTAQT